MENEIMSTCSKQSLMRDVMAHSFAAADLQLYLDTHPNDEKAMALYKEAVEKSKAVTSEYEEKYGSLTAQNTKKEVPWQWIRSPWTWEGGLY